MIRWPKVAGRAIAKLFMGAQDIDVFVEDQDDEQFYLQLIRNATKGELNIKRVVGLGGSKEVINAAKEYAEERKALFLIDGDLPFVRGEPQPDVPRLFRLSCYCVENLLIASRPALKICAEESMCDLEEMSQRFNFIDWRERMAALIPLFARFAVISEMSPETPTVGEGFVAVSENDKNGLPALSVGKIDSFIAKLDSDIFRILGDDAGAQKISEALDRLGSLDDPLRSVSAKHFLLPLLHFELKRVSGSKATKAVFRHRLAVNSSPDNLEMLAAAIETAA